MRGSIAAALALCFGLGCTESARYQAAMCTLVDVSGTYAREKGEVVKTIKSGILPKLLPGDSLFVILIDSESYEEENLVASLKTQRRRLEANAQKLRFAAGLDELAASPLRSDFTDISGAMMLCADYLKNSRAGKQMVLVFSDMEEDLPRGVTREFDPGEFEGMEFAAVNVIKLKADNAQPTKYRGRLMEWERRLTDAGAREWAVIFDPTEIPEYIEARR